MGAKIAYLSIMLSLLVLVFTCIALALPLHRLNFRWFFGIGHAGDIYIYAVWVKADMELLTTHLRDDWFRTHRSTWDMRQVVDRMCSPFNRLKFGNNMCDGLQAAYGAGMFLFACVVINALFLQGFASFLLFTYAAIKPSRKTRTTATVLLIVGLFLVLACLMVYIFAVTIPMDSYDNNLLRQAVLGESPATGFDYGLYLLILVMVCQVIQVVVSFMIQGSDEEIYESMKYDCHGEGYGATAYSGASGSSAVYQVTDITIQPVRQGQPQVVAFGAAW